MALTLNGSNLWPSAKELVQFGEQRSIGTRQTFIRVFEHISDALAETAREVESYGKQNPAFSPVGPRMLEQWQVGRRDSLSLN